MNPAGKGLLQRILGALRVTLALDTHPRAKVVRMLTVAALSLVAFIVVGNGVFVKPLRHMAEKPFEFDWALRTLSLGWFDESRTLPVAMVEIDEATYRAWGSPAMTPRADVARMLEVVTRSLPAAVFVDLDVAFGTDAAADDALGRFLQAYAGPVPLVFPRRIETDERGLRRLAATPFDALFAANPRLHWSHASFAADGGVVREWDPWLVVCAGDQPQALPAVATALAEALPAGWHGLARRVPAPTATSCAEEPEVKQSLLIGQRLTGAGHPPLMREASLVSASALLDPALERDDAALFADRIVFIGATHAGSGDFWVTPSGALPGVELVANTVRFLPLQQPSGGRGEMAYRVATLSFFLLLGMLFWLFRPSVAVAVLIPLSLALVALAVGAWGYFRVFDALAAALLLMVQCKTIEAGLTLVADWRRYGWRRTILAKHFRPGSDEED